MPVWKDASDAAAFVRRYSGMILRLCFTYSLGRADAQDICQNVFLKLLQSDRRFDSEGETRAFIIRITINECKDVLKSGWRRRSVPLDELIEREVPFLPEENTGVLAAVQRLPVKYREAVYLYYYEGYNAEEIAAMVGAKPAAVRQRLARAREKLRKELEGSGYERV
ncbi:RNA polymerase sigma factor [Agathobaculum sp.]|uniref:RNA polymerase sigma factor n=1 Tax=Agathobaculum sp. TaxID=2048138 RepID=UPI00399FDC0F